MAYISFRDEFVPLILSGAKTQTRRLIKPRPSLAYLRGDGQMGWNDLDGKPQKNTPCPFGREGEILEIRDAEIRLKIEEIRVERVSEISESDAVAEGFVSDLEDAGFSAVNSFVEVWDDIYGEGSFDSDPFVWVIIFSRC